MDDAEQFDVSPYPVASCEDLADLPTHVHALIARALDDRLLTAIAAKVPGVRHVMTNGSNSVTDDGLRLLAVFPQIESVDLEWRRVTDAGLRSVANCESHRWLDLALCEGVTGDGRAWLRGARPDPDIESLAT